jgi:nucleoside transporter
MTPGFWFPALTNILNAQGLGSWVAVAFAVAPVCALISPLMGGAVADQRVAADRLFVWTSLMAAVTLFAAFWTLEQGWHAWWFIGLLAMYSLISGPSWGLLATISLTHLAHGERQFPLVRVGGTLGWMGAGLATSYLLKADASPITGYAATVTRVLSGVCAVFLPHTPPLGRGRDWKSLLGFNAFSLLKQRDHCVFFVVTGLFSIPLAAFYMYAPEQLKILGDAHPTATMTIGQWSEIIAMLMVGVVMSRYRLKVVLLWALGLSVARYAMSAYSGGSGLINWHIAGIALNGVCYTFYFITAQVFLDRRVDPAMKGQAQGLLALVSGGLGPLIGAAVCGWLRSQYADDGAAGWAWFWGILSAMIGVCFLLLAIFYRGLGRRNPVALEPPSSALAGEDPGPLQTKL